jgi:glutamyl/glutaminyl-tRNA synthetase
LRTYLSHLKLSPTDTDLLLAHLQHSDLLAREECDISGQKVSLIKLANSISKKEAPAISQKEKAKFVLDQSIASLDENMTKTQLKIHKLNEDIRSLVKMGSKKNAVTLLAQKKKLESFLERISSQRYQLED